MQEKPEITKNPWLLNMPFEGLEQLMAEMQKPERQTTLWPLGQAPPG